MPSPIKVITAPATFQEFCLDHKRQGKTIGVVPTMGALHRGHLSLVEASNELADVTVVTVFVNPTQFGPQEDFEKYPRTLEEDLRQLDSYKVDAVFTPSAEAMYPPGSSTKVIPPTVAESLEGPLRPGHFQGVATVVLKLLNLSCCDVAVFGQKDYQQLAVIRQMVSDLNVPAKIVAAPIVRESDGLALSSRNRYLDAEQRERAKALSQALRVVQERFDSGSRDARELAADLMQELIDGGVDSADYAVIADADSLEIVDTIQNPAVALVAAYVGETRLIDNCLLIP